MIWNGIRCGSEPCHVSPMLFIIYLVWAVFFFLAGRQPFAYEPRLVMRLQDFT